jgi:hypothetical protein
MAKILIVVVLLVSAVASLSANAQEREHREREWRGDIRRFHEHDLVRWHRGHWFHGRYRGRVAWWWVVDGIYYAYPAPVYPYPDPYTPPVAIVPLPSVAQTPPAPSTPGNEPGTWYYCDAARGYYPYVRECPSGWRPVPATPPPG